MCGCGLLPFLGATPIRVRITQGDAIGLGYIGLSARNGIMKNVCDKAKFPANKFPIATPRAESPKYPSPMATPWGRKYAVPAITVSPWVRMNDSGECFKNIGGRKYAAAAITASHVFRKYASAAFSIYMRVKWPAAKTLHRHCRKSYLISTLFS
jgi:hypothetical protein